MRKSELDLSSFFEIIALQRILSLRALVYRSGKSWRLHSGILVNSTSTTGVTGFLRYGDVGFIIKRLTGAAAARDLREGRLLCDGTAILFPKLQSKVWADQFPSHSGQIRLAKKYPFTAYNLGFAGADTRLDEFTPLIAPGRPSFPNLKSAVLFYLYEEGTDSGRELSLNNYFLLQVHQRLCWIDKVHLAPTSISIDIKGVKVAGVRLEIWVGSTHFQKSINKAGRVTLPLQTGLRDKIWIVVSRGRQWLDHREIDLRYRSVSEASDTLTFEHDDPTNRLKGIIVLGESETTEFKVQVPEARESSKLMKTVSAFANGSGGMIIIGVDDSGSIKGISGNFDRERVRLTQMIRNNLVPQPITSIYKHAIDGLCVLVVEVKKGEHPPYGVGQSNPNYYVRRGATSFPATPDEVRILSNNKDSEFKLGLWRS